MPSRSCSPLRVTYIRHVPSGSPEGRLNSLPFFYLSTRLRLLSLLIASRSGQGKSSRSFLPVIHRLPTRECGNVSGYVPSVVHRARYALLFPFRLGFWDVWLVPPFLFSCDLSSHMGPVKNLCTCCLVLIFRACLPVPGIHCASTEGFDRRDPGLKQINVLFLEAISEIKDCGAAAR